MLSYPKHGEYVIVPTYKELAMLSSNMDGKLSLGAHVKSENVIILGAHVINLNGHIYGRLNNKEK